MPTYTHLKGVSDIRKTQPTQAIVENLIDYFNWSLLEAEGFTDVPVSTPGLDDQYEEEKLFPVHQEGMEDGIIWQSINTDWVWETGLESGSQPTVASGVYVDGVFYPTNTTGPMAHYVNFPAGQVIFDTPIPVTSVVQAAYSWRWISIYNNDVSWFRDVVFDALLLDQEANSKDGKGVIALLDSYRVQPPMIIVEPVMSRRMKALELGSGTHTVYQDMLFHIITERAEERNNLLDIITLETDKTIILYDVNARRQANEYGIDWRGMKVEGGKMYPELVSDFPWKRCVFNKMVGEEVTLRLPLFRGIIRATLEVDIGVV